MTRSTQLLLGLACCLVTSVAAAQTAASAPKPMDGKASDPPKTKTDTNKAGKPPVAEAASQPTAKKPAKPGAQSGPASSPKP